METYVKPNLEIVEIPGYAVITVDTCDNKTPDMTASDNELIGG